MPRTTRIVKKMKALREAKVPTGKGEAVRDYN
jgi:hypothetical protein